MYINYKPQEFILTFLGKKFLKKIENWSSFPVYIHILLKKYFPVVYIFNR
jgi:hypothetical protein